MIQIDVRCNYRKRDFEKTAALSQNRRSLFDKLSSGLFVLFTILFLKYLFFRPQIQSTDPAFRLLHILFGSICDTQSSSSHNTRPHEPLAAQSPVCRTTMGRRTVCRSGLSRPRPADACPRGAIANWFTRGEWLRSAPRVAAVEGVHAN
jgi:hypothetical protein